MPKNSKHLVLLGDLGVGINLVKNIFFLDDAYSCPFDHTVVDIIYESKNCVNWLTNEYRTRMWGDHDISDVVPVDLQLPSEPTTIYINHSVFHTVEDLDTIQKQNVDIILLAPESDLAFDWQIRAYTEKLGIDSMHNFTFSTVIEKSKQNYIAEYGQHAYNTLNLDNMYCLMKERKDRLVSLCRERDISVLYVDSLYEGNFRKFFEDSKQYISVDYVKAEKIHHAWHCCHWPYSLTQDWKYYAKTN